MQCMCSAIDLSSERNGLPSEQHVQQIKCDPRVKWQVCEELNVPMFIQPLTGNTALNLCPNCDSSGSSHIKLHIYYKLHVQKLTYVLLDTENTVGTQDREAAIQTSVSKLHVALTSINMPPWDWGSVSERQTVRDRQTDWQEGK